jgi:hypothetical protein
MNSRIVRTILGIRTGQQLALAMKFELSMFLPSRVPHNVSARDTVLGSAYNNLECYLMRLRITLNRSIRQQEDILNPGFPLHAESVARRVGGLQRRHASQITCWRYSNGAEIRCP